MNPERMPAISLWQPWASMMLHGKVHETRSWRAPLHLVGKRWAIHATKQHIRLGDLDPPTADVIVQALGEHAIVPVGSVIAVGRLAYCHPTAHLEPASYQDRLLGDWTAGRYAWRFEDVVKLRIPVYLRGSQRIWYVPPEFARHIEEQLQ